MIEFKESKFYKLLQDFFINNNKETFLQMLAEFYNRTEGIIEKNVNQDELIKELRELYLEFNEKGIDENIVIEKVNYFVENNVKIKDIIAKLVINTNNIKNITSQMDIITNEKVNIKMFDAKGDGVTDDTQSLINAIEHIKLKGGTIYFPIGTYLISSKIKLYSNITLLGETNNTILKANSDNYGFIIFGNNVEINNLKLDGNGENYNVNKIIDCDYENKKQTKNFSLINCHIGNIKANWCHGVSLAYSENSTISNCVFDGFKSSGNGTIGDLDGSARAIVISDNCNGYKIENNTFKGLSDEEDSDFIHVKGVKVLDNNFPYMGEMFGKCKGDIKNNTFLGFMKSAIKVQAQDVNISENTIDIRDIEGKKPYSAIRIQNSTNCIVSNNKVLLNSNEKISNVYVLQRSKNVIYSNNNVVYSGYRDNTLTETDRSMFIIHQSEDCIIDGVNIVGKNYFNRFVWLEEPSNIIIKNINYDNSGYSISNIFYFTQKDEKAKITFENINVNCDKVDKPLYSVGEYGGSLKIKNVEINVNDTVSSNLFKQSVINNYENLEIDNFKLYKNFIINLDGCKNINVENSSFKTLQLSNAVGFNLKSMNNMFTSDDVNNCCYHLILDNTGVYNLFSKNNVNNNAKNMFLIQDGDVPFTNANNLKVKSIDDSYSDYALSNVSNFIGTTGGSSPTYESYYIKTSYLFDRITKGWQNMRHPVVLANGTVFYQNQDGSNNKAFLVLEKNNVNTFIEFSIS